MGVYVVQGLTLEASYDSGGRWFRGVGNDDGVVAGSRLHNHLQSSGERNTSRAHSRSTSSANPSPALLSRHSIATILFPRGKGRCGLEWQGNGLVHQASWGAGLMAVSAEDRELVGEECLAGLGEQGSAVLGWGIPLSGCCGISSAISSPP